MKFSAYIKITYIIFLCTTLIFSQSFQLKNQPSDNIQFHLNYLHPVYKEINVQYYAENKNLNMISLGMNVPVSEKINLVFNLPVAFMNWEIKYKNQNTSQQNPDRSLSESALGNIYFAFQLAYGRKSPSALNFEIGIYLPTISDDKNLSTNLAMFANYYNIAEYLHNAIAINAFVSKWYIISDVFEWGFEAGPVALFSNTGNSRRELFLHLSSGFNVNINRLYWGFEFLGMMNGSSNFNDISDQFVSSVVFGAGYKFSNIIPNIFYKFDFNSDVTKYQSGLFGIKVITEL